MTTRCIPLVTLPRASSMDYRSIFLLLSFVLYSEAYKILICYPLPIKSLNMLGEGFVRHLLNAGHEVTYITVFPNKGNTHKKLRQIDIGKNLNLFTGDDTLKISYIMENNIESDLSYVQEFTIKTANATFENEDVRRILEDPKEYFDAVIVDYLEIEIYSGIAEIFGCPMIWSYAMGAHWQVLRLIDQETNPTYGLDYLSENIPPFTFMQRLQELWLHIKWHMLKRFTTAPNEEIMYENYFRPLIAKRGRHVPSFQNLIYNASLIFGNEHHAFGNNPATPQNFKFIGGYHIKNPAKALPKDLQDLMDNAKHGVIYFSMGSTWQSKDIPKHITQGLLQMFGQFKQIVIWKYEENLPNVPKNVKILKWAPQPSILSHPNCLFFITHGGHLSSTEALHFGIPKIGVPIYFDQFMNINKAVAKGYAIKVDLTMDLVKNLKSAMEVMLTNPKYREKAKELSAIYHDRPISPGAEMVHWVEHVIKTRGAPHLRSPALQVPCYQKMYLDLLVIILAVTVLFYILILKVCLKSSKEKQNKSSNKKKN